MNFNIVMERRFLYQSLQKVVNVISTRPRLPILSHVLLEVRKDCVLMSATDLEVEITVQVSLSHIYSVGISTIPGRKFFEICRSFSEDTKISMVSKNNKININSGDSNFSLSTLFAEDFPKSEIWNNSLQLIISRIVFKKMLEITQFAMGNQDVRYYLNGIFFESKKHTIRIVATDGYRLAACKVSVDFEVPSQSIIIPRKGIAEILRLLNIEEELINIQTNNHSVRIQIGNYTLISKLVDSVFPDYHDVFVKKPKNVLIVQCDILIQTLKRVAILSNEKLRIIQFNLTINSLKITAYNFEHETAEETLKVVYSGRDMRISFNVDYILDALNVIGSQMLRFCIQDEISSVQIEGVSKCYDATYIVMPVRM